MQDMLPIPSARLDAYVASRAKGAQLIDGIFASLAELDSVMMDLGVLEGVFAVLRPSLKCYGRETLLNDLSRSPELLRNRMDATLWDVLFKASGVRSFMDAETRRAFRKDRDNLDIVPLTADNVRSTFKDLYANRDKMFADGVENLFRRLSWDHRTNKPIGFGPKLIFQARSTLQTTGVSPDVADIIDDLVRAICVLSGIPEPDHRNGAMKTLSPVMDTPRGKWQGPYFRIRWFKNGFLHLTFNDPGIAVRLNKVLASRYPEALARR